MLSEQDRRDLAEAKRRLERDSLAVRLTTLLGTPIEKGLALLPADVAGRVHRITRGALERGLEVALTTLARDTPRPAADRLHKVAAAASGAVGGAFGLAGLAVELPVTTVIMLRAIAAIARAEGHDLRSPEAQLACLEVFALGGPSKADDAAETGYYAVRSALAAALADAAEHIATRGFGSGSAPALVRAVSSIAARFGIVVQEKVALEAVPVIGALSGSAINTVFMKHFQDKARGHFVIKRLERAHGLEAVRRAYESLEPIDVAASPVE